jgi:hypothetical protein
MRDGNGKENCLAFDRIRETVLYGYGVCLDA